MNKNKQDPKKQTDYFPIFPVSQTSAKCWCQIKWWNILCQTQLFFICLIYSKIHTPATLLHVIFYPDPRACFKWY